MTIKLKRTSPTYHQPNSTGKIMRDLLIAEIFLAICSILLQYYRHNSAYAFKAFMMYVVAVAVAIIIECIWAKLHKQPLKTIFTDSFCLNTPLIYTLTLPVGTPYYVVAIGAFIATFFGKLVYGGFGQNIFNPALVGRVVVHLSFASKLTNVLPGVDTATSATPATMLASTNWFGGSGFTYSLSDLFFGMHDGALGEGCIIAIIIVAIILAIRHVYDTRITISYLGTVALLAIVAACVMGLNPFKYMLTHLMLGGLMLGAVLMATDPVTSPTSPLGKIIYGICLGFLTMLIRLKANYPEGVLFSILIMNMLTPFIDSLILGRTNEQLKKQSLSIVIALVVSAVIIGGVSATLEPVTPATSYEAGERYEINS